MKEALPGKSPAPLADPRPLARLAAWAGLDFHVAGILLFRGWTILAGAVSIILLPLWLSPLQQGYYYTFASILALQVFFELGLNQILVQIVAHEAAHLQFADHGQMLGDARHLDRLGSVARLMRRWYATAAAIFLVVVSAAGVAFFSSKGVLPGSAWLGAWLVLVAATAANLFLSPSLAMMEGLGQVGQVARVRLRQSVVGYLLLWLSLSVGLGLWAAVAMPLAAALSSGWWLHRRGVVLGRLAARDTVPEQRLQWRRDILPFQWRIALSWASGYFIFNLFTPLVFSHQGAVEAGRLGLALTIFAAASTVGMSWISAANPALAAHIARGERVQLDTLFAGVTRRAVGATAVVSIGVLATAWLLERMGLPAMSRVASLPALACIAWVTVVNSVVFAAAAYMRAHREEPMLPVSIVGAALTAAVAWLGSRTGVPAMMAMYAVITTCVTLPWTLLLFRRYARGST